MEHSKAHYKGLQTCGSVWHCPVCAAKISERRRAELMAAIATWKAQGGSVLFLTLTNSHDRKDRLADLLEGQRKALKRFWNDRASRQLWEGLGVAGSIKATEVTHGASGGILTITCSCSCLNVVGRGPAFPVATRPRATVARLLPGGWPPLPDLSHGCTLQDGSKAARYASSGASPRK